MGLAFVDSAPVLSIGAQFGHVCFLGRQKVLVVGQGYHKGHEEHEKESLTVHSA